MKKPSRNLVWRLARISLAIFAMLLFASHALAQNYVLSNLWSIAAGSQPYFGTSGVERGLAYNPVTGHLLLATRAPAAPTTPAAVMVLDADTGDVVSNLSIAGLVTSGPGMTFNMNMLGVADDGVIYACNLANVAIEPTNNFIIYRWQDESSDPTQAYKGNLGLDSDTGLIRFGDSFDVRGSGTNTMMIVGQGTAGQRFAIFTTVDGTNFTSQVFTNAAAASAEFYRGLAFGPGNTFFSRNTGNPNLHLSSFDLATGATEFIQTYTLTDNNFEAMSFNTANNLLLMIRGNASNSTNQFVNLYAVSTNNLATPPALLDTKYFLTNRASPNLVGAVDFGGDKVFALNVQNSLMAFRIVESSVANPPSINVQPESQTGYAGAPVVSFTPIITGTQPIVYQWFKDGEPIPDATNSTYVLTNLTTGMSGTYSLSVSNSAATIFSSNAVLTVLAPFNTAQMTNVWTLLPNSRDYVGGSDQQRGMAFNPATSNLLIVSRSTASNVVVLDSLTGAEKHFLTGDPFTIVPAGGPVTFAVSKIGISDDGVVYVANLVTAGNASSFRIYSWADDSPDSVPQLAFIGDPGLGSNLRWGDSMAVRGSGLDTQILFIAGSGSTVSLIRMSGDGVTLDQTPVVIDAIDTNPLPSYNVSSSIAFGTGTTFWTKTYGQPLRQIEFDPINGAAIVSRFYPFANENTVPGVVSTIAVDTNKQMLAALSFETPDNVRLYGIENLDAGPVLRDQEVFSTDASNANHLGAAVFGGDYLYVLDSNNGIKAFLINTNFVPELLSFPITSVVLNDNAEVVLTWQSEVGREYQVQTKNSLSDLQWIDLGSPISATETSTSFTNTVSGDARFYQILGR